MASAACLPWAVHASGAPADAELSAYAAPGTPIRTDDGRRLNVVCMGAGSPTVVLEAGGGNFSTAWWRTQPQIARLTRVCAYDRAGFNYSDPSRRPPTAENAADDLRQVIRAVSQGRPVVLVGHSFGGLIGTLYADRRLPDVAGLVLVDPSFAGQLPELTAHYSDEEKAKTRAAMGAAAPHFTRCAALARTGQTEELAKGCYALPPTLSPEPIRAAMLRNVLKPEHYEQTFAEGSLSAGDGLSIGENDRAEMAAARSFGGLPLIVLTAGRPTTSPIVSAESQAKAAAAWKAGHARLAARSTRGEHRVVDGAGHMIQLERPDAVVQAVRDVVETVRR